MRENQFFFDKQVVDTAREFAYRVKRKGQEDADNDIKKSQYFWWWYALTLNEDYIRLCEKHDGMSVYEPKTDEEKRYNDFGDVRYEGNKVEAFINWWNKAVVLPNTDPIPNRPVKKSMSRGEYLFSEPLLDGWILQVEDLEQAEKSLSLESHALISIPLTTSKKHTAKRINELLERFHPAYMDSERKDPKKSKALYPPVSNAQVSKLQLMFKVYDFRKQLEEDGKSMSNPEIAEQLNISVQVEDAEEGYDMSGDAEQYLKNGERISKLYGYAKTLIDNVGKGLFPITE